MNEVLYRAMRPDADGRPEVGPHAEKIGVRAEDDIPVTSEGMVHPQSGGMSVTANDPMMLPVHRRPINMQGNSKKTVVFKIEQPELPGCLVARIDKPIELPAHRSIEPRECCTFLLFEQALASTRDNWRKL